MKKILTRYFQNLRSFSTIDPERDWIVLLILASITLVIIIVWNAYAFDTVAGGGVIGAPTKSSAPVFSQSSLDAIHKVFTDRAAEEEKYASDVYHYSDPSQ
jgi:hypothetical protein